jgi:hypothetical protein
MTDDPTARWALPLLAAGQAQKEVTHNEALALIDLILDPLVEVVGATTPPEAPEPGRCWVVGAGASGAWSGQDAMLAGWTAGGWRFAAPQQGGAVRVRATGAVHRWTGAAWLAPPVVEPLTGGTTTDAEARAAIAMLVDALRAAGLLG